MSLIHLAHAHRKVMVPDAPGATDMSVDRNIVGRIGADRVDHIIAEKRREGVRFARISAEELVTPEQPKVAQPSDRRSLVPIGRYIVPGRGVRAISRALARLVQNDIDPGQ